MQEKHKSQVEIDRAYIYLLEIRRIVCQHFFKNDYSIFVSDLSNSLFKNKAIEARCKYKQNIFDDLKTSHCAMLSKMKKEHSAVVISYKWQLQQV